jgi:hypothetical protein
MYKLLKDDKGILCSSILRLLDNASIPFDPANTDYQAYLKWLEEGNTPLPADE